jgi:hypothetical protein
LGARCFAPLALGLFPLLLRECAWSYLGDGSTAYAMTLAGQNLSAAKYALLACEYLCEAASGTHTNNNTVLQKASVFYGGTIYGNPAPSPK